MPAPKTPRMPKPDESSKDFFHGVVPDAPGVRVRPMFGNLAAFVNGNMFMGLFGSDIFLRLSEEDRGRVAAAGGGPFEPLPGRPMREYAVLPSAWRTQPDRVHEWAGRALDLAEELPPKQPKPRKPRRS